jgi:NAD(P)-dependent dehydrogenase (short-subunit alcohol dehydrogenase family)
LKVSFVLATHSFLESSALGEPIPADGAGAPIRQKLNEGSRSMSSFAGTTTIVTGGARGIGERVAEDLVAQGGNVIIGDGNHDLGDELSSRLGGKAKFIDLDVSRSSDCSRAVELAQPALGGVLVNAAISINAKPLIELSETEWRKTLDVGLTIRHSTSKANGTSHARPRWAAPPVSRALRGIHREP